MNDLRERIKEIIQEESLNGADAVKDVFKMQKRIMWRCGMEVLKDYPELEFYEGKPGNPLFGKGEGGAPN